MIDVRFASEERYARISIGYDTKEEGGKVTCSVDSVIAKYDIKPQVYTTDVLHGRSVMVIEYHDDMDREAGDIFEEIMQTLDVASCS